MKKFQSSLSATNKIRFNKKVVVSLFALVLFTGSLALLDNYNIIDLPFLKDKNKTSSGQGSENNINYSPPTEEEKKETEAFKESQVLNNDNPSTNQSTPGAIKQVVPVVSSWGQSPQTKDVEISGFIPGVIEEGGECIVTLSKNNEKVTKSSLGTANAQNVSCGVISIPFSNISTGTWNIALSYNSSTAKGSSSQNVSVEVQ